MERLRLKPAPFDLLPIALAVAVAILPMYPRERKAETAVVYRAHEKIMTIPIDRDTTFAVQTEVGEWVLVIENGEVYAVEAHCPKHLCMEMGRISRPGASIICAPGKAAVVIEGGEELDAVTR